MRRTFENILAIISGVIIGGLGTVVHNFSLGWFPFGVLVALSGSFTASKALGIRFGRKAVRIWFLIGWTLIVLRASIFGNSDELLIMANGTGNTYLGLGFLLVVIAIWTRL
jgi:hypothetical protein